MDAQPERLPDQDGPVPASDGSVERVVLVLMGVSGSGKSTIAGRLAGRLGWDFEEGDALHPPANVAKMAAGHPLDDEDRWPWLARVGEWITQHTEAGRCGVVACSALKRSYRDVLRGEHVVFVYLSGSYDEIAARLAVRLGHFMPAELLASQFRALEPPAPDERAITIGIDPEAATEVDQIIARLGLVPNGASSSTG